MKESKKLLALVTTVAAFVIVLQMIEIQGLHQVIESQLEYIATLEEDFGEEFFNE